MKAQANVLQAYNVALYFLYRARELEAGDTISNLKMQKLLYYAQGHFLALFQKPLFSEVIQAWQHGPVVKEVYDKFHIYGSNAIDFKELENFKSSLYTQEHLDFLPFIFNKYNSFGAWELVEKTHNEPLWQKHYSRYNTNEIPMQEIQAYFTQQLDKEAKQYL